MVSRSLGANPDNLKDPIKISIPRYVLCGQGKDEHFEFEVKVSVPSLLFWGMEARGSAVLSFLYMELKLHMNVLFCTILVMPFFKPVRESLGWSTWREVIP